MDLREASHTGPRHPWEVARFRFFADRLQRASVLDRRVDVLDVGAGDAWFATQLLGKLPAGSEITCWDNGYPEAEEQRAPGLRLVHQQPSVKADVVILLDVLEHVEHDVSFLESIVRKNTHPGAHVLISVPAWQSLYTSRDEYLSHHRRYSPAQGRALATSAGLTIVEEGGVFHSLLAPRTMTKVYEMAMGAMRLELRANRPPEWHAGPIVTACVSAALAVDNAVSHVLSRVGIAAPGLSWWALCRVGASA